MIVSTNLVPVLVRIIKGAPSHFLLPVKTPLPYSWNYNHRKFEVVSTYPFWWWKLVCFVYTCAVISNLAFGGINSDNVVFWESVLRYSLILLQISCASCFCSFHRFYAPDVCHFFNNLIRFEARHSLASQRYKWRSKESRLIRCLSYILYVSGPMVNVMSPLVSVIIPTSPFNVWASLYTLYIHYYPETCHTVYVTPILIFMLNYYFWLLVMDGVVISVAGIFMCGIYSLKCCMKAFRQATQKFFSKSALQMYREIQILANFYNLTNRNAGTAGVVLCSVISAITFSYLAVGNFRLLHPIMLLTCLVIIFSSNSLIVFAFRLASDVHKNGCQDFKRIEQKLREHNGSDVKRMKRVWKSCPTIRVEFFGNFFDESTPLVLLQFCVVQTASLILLNR